MPTYSQTDLSTRVMRYLNLVGIDEVPDGASLDDANEVIASDISSMSIRGMPIWDGSVMAVPQEFLMPLTVRLSIPIAVSNGMMRATDAPAAMLQAESFLRELSSVPPTGVVAEGEYF